MQEYFNRMQDIVSRNAQSKEGQGYVKINSRIRFMLQDVIDLRANKWIPRRNENNPKTIDQIQKEAESERLDMQVNSASLNPPRKDDRNNDRKRNRKSYLIRSVFLALFVKSTFSAVTLTVVYPDELLLTIIFYIRWTRWT